MINMIRSCFFYLFFSVVAGHAQVNLDSLNRVWQNPELADTARTQAIYKMIWDGYMYKKLDSATYYSQQALAFSIDRKLKKQEGEFYNSLGTTYYLSNQYPQAEENYLNSLRVMEELKYEKGIAAALTNLGTVQSVLGNHSLALDYLLRGLEIRENLGDMIGAAVALNNIGNIYRRQEFFDKAIQCHKRALEIYQEKQNKRGISNSQLNLGLDYFDQSDFETALLYFNTSLSTQTEIGYKGGMVQSLTNLGLIYIGLADYPKAIEYFNRSLEISIETKDQSSQASAFNNLGIVYYYQGNYQKALQSYEAALEIRRKTNVSSGISSSLNNIGIIYKSLKKYDLALRYYMESRDLALEKGINSVIVSSLNNISAVYYAKGDLANALDYLNQSMELQNENGDQLLKSNTMTSIATALFEMNKVAEALEWCQKSLEISISLQAEREILVARRTLLQVLVNLEKYTEAENAADQITETDRKYLNMNFPVMTENEQAEYFKTISGDFDLKFSLALKRKNENPSICGNAYNDALYMKGILLKSSTATRNAILSGGDSLLISKYNEWIILKRQITKKASSGKEVLEMEMRADSLERFLVQSSRELSDFKTIQNQSWQDVQLNLNKHEAAVEIIHFNKKKFAPRDTISEIVYCALIVKPESNFPEMIELFEETQLESILGNTYGNNLNFVNKVYGIREAKNSALYDLIWKPIENSLDGTKKVFLSPSGLLHKISFAALSKEQNVYLCDNFDIEMMASTGKLISSDEFVYNAGSATTIFGGIDYSTDSTKTEMWNYLEGTRREAETIDEILASKKIPVTYLNSMNATETEFKQRASGSTILHIATHGFFFPDPGELFEESEPEINEVVNFRGRSLGYTDFVENKNPLMRSGLVFAGANDVWSTESFTGDDGVLTAQEVAHIDMRNTELVVLSACETGLGDIRGSEGVYGLQRAFKMAGVKFIIMSLWQVPDKETAEFMSLFYKKLFQRKDIQSAFSETQKVMRKKYDPYYWAAFVLME